MEEERSYGCLYKTENYKNFTTDAQYYDSLLLAPVSTCSDAQYFMTYFFFFTLEWRVEVSWKFLTSKVKPLSYLKYPNFLKNDYLKALCYVKFDVSKSVDPLLVYLEKWKNDYLKALSYVKFDVSKSVDPLLVYLEKWSPNELQKRIKFNCGFCFFPWLVIFLQFFSLDLICLPTLFDKFFNYLLSCIGFFFFFYFFKNSNIL